MSLSKQLGESIRSIRKGKGISQEQLAEEVSVHFTFIGQFERGEKNLSIDTLERVLNALDISLIELVRHLPKNKNNPDDKKLELLINRIQEIKPKERDAILNIFHEILDLKEL